MSPSATTSKESALPRLRWAWDFGPLLGDVDTGRLLALLTAVAEEGALGNAAKRAGMSYRSARRAFRSEGSLTQSGRGGGACFFAYLLARARK